MNKKTINHFTRSIFLNLFIEIFIVMCYFYISEYFGSISTTFLVSNSFSVSFGITLLIFSFFAVLVGPYHGFFAGFIGETLYQLSFYSSIHFNWIIIIALYGLMCGFYKYKPLKYQNHKNIYYTIILLIISSIASLFIISISEFISNYVSFSFYFIIVNYGLTFLIQALISTVFLVPLLLFLYDKFLATQERHIYYLLLTHHPHSESDHTFYLQFGRTKIYFCSRCSGVVLGGIISTFFTHLIQLIWNVRLSPEIALILIICVPIPGLLDWGTQRLLLRKSTTSSRLFTGFIIGAGLHLISLTYEYYFITLIIIALYFFILFLLMFLGYKKQLRLFREELDSFSNEYEYNIIFIHGLESSGKGFKAQYLKSLFPNIYTPDFKMFDPKINLKSLLFERMNQLDAILEEKKRWIIIGSSFGGLMGTLYALKQPEKVECLILLAPFLAIDEFINLNLKPVDIPVVVYHGRNDTIVPLDITQQRAKKLFSNLQYNVVDDDHQLHSTVKHIDWKNLLHII